MHVGAALSTLVVMALALGSLATIAAAEAQRDRKIPRVGTLMIGSPSAAKPYVEGFAQGLRELGYREGENVTVEYRYTEGKADELHAAAAGLVLAEVDVIVAWGTPAVAAAKRATRALPIVFVAVGDPVGTGLIASLTKPGGNVTGLTNMSAELSAKQLELLREVVPALTRVAVLRNPVNPVSAPQLKWTSLAAGPLNLQLQVIDVRAPGELETAFLAATREKAGAMTVLADPMFLGHRARIAELALRSRLPTTFNWRQYVDAGGLIAYGPSLEELWRRAATFVDRILKGARPADLPVEQPTKLELVINMKTARALALTITPSLLLRADQILE